MSVRYGVALIPEPSFTARVYRARQLICGQYGAWAAEMHLIQLPVVEFFECTDPTEEELSSGLARIAEQTRERALRFPLLSRGVATLPVNVGDIHLDFTVSANPRERQQRELNLLHTSVLGLLEQTEGVIPPDAGSSGENYHPHINLMQHADLPASVFDSAVDFARAVLRDLEVPNDTRAWQMLFIRFESDAAGNDWGAGRWAADLRWRVLAAYPM